MVGTQSTTPTEKSKLKHVSKKHETQVLLIEMLQELNKLHFSLTAPIKLINTKSVHSPTA